MRIARKMEWKFIGPVQTVRGGSAMKTEQRNSTSFRLFQRLDMITKVDEEKSEDGTRVTLIFTCKREGCTAETDKHEVTVTLTAPDSLTYAGTAEGSNCDTDT